MMKSFFNLFSLGLLATCAFVSAIQGTVESKQFPQLFGQSYSNKKELKIVSESVSETTGYQTIEEYIDLELGRTSTVVIGKDGQRVLYQNGAKELGYDYKPYTCNVKKLKELSITWLDPIELSKDFQFSGHTLRWTGVVGVWLYMSSASKKVRDSRVIYSGSKDVYHGATCWSSQAQQETQQKPFEVSFCFTGSSSNDSQPLTPETIEFKVDGKVSKTMNVLSIEYSISDREREEYLEVPVGYGCFDEAQRQAEALPLADVWQKIMHLKTHVDLEITATVFEKLKATSDTWNVEFASSLVGKKPIRLLRFKSTIQDIKTVYNHFSQVAYKIDLKSGACEMYHLEGEREAHKDDDVYEHAWIRFQNGATLDFNQYMTLMAKVEGYHFIKKLAPSQRSPVERNIYESKLDNRLLSTVLETIDVRGVRVYEKLGEDNWQLQSLTILVLSSDKTKILQSIQVNVIDARIIENRWPDEARLFDVSEECYLNNERMIQNKDYAWFDLKYLADMRSLRWAKSNELTLKRDFYTSVIRLVSADVTRMPRIEISFDEKGFVLRVLLLDLPPLQHIYEKFAKKRLNFRQDVEELAPDLDHCAHMCRLHHCTTMTYCSGAKGRCYTESRSLKSVDDEKEALVYDSNCDTWLQPNGGFKWTTLHNLLARLRHTNYETQMVGIPEVPEELRVAQHESGLSDSMYAKALEDYHMKVLDYLAQETTQVPELAVRASIEYVLPSRFELENDPLGEFDLNDIANFAEDDDDELEEDEDSKVPAFHVGLSETRFKYAFEPKKSNQGDEEEVHTRQLSGLTYDQCTLACKDTRCGTFSYCSTRHECTLSSATSIGQARRMEIIDHDIDCLLMERDFLNNYNKIAAVSEPKFSMGKLKAGSASECALKCASEKGYTCLSFQYCVEPQEVLGAKQEGKCFLQVDRDPDLSLDTEAMLQKASSRASNLKEATKCDHYLRSYLADFNRFEYSAIVDEQMSQLVTTKLSGLSVFACAEKCATELADCTAFQSCHFIPRELGDRFGRECIFIQGRASNKEAENEKKKQDGDDMKAADRFFEHNQNCQVFSLRKNSIEAHVRDLALGGLETVSEQRSETRGTKSIDGGGGGFSFGGALILYACVALVSASLSCVFVYLRDTENVYVRSKVDRFRATFGL